MTEKEIVSHLNSSIQTFLEHDTGLLSVDVNERSLTHKFAEYLQSCVGNEWSVDCEYNRYGDDVKTIPRVTDVVGYDATTEDLKAKTIFPDIIVHQRGAGGQNLLVIEAKKDATKKEKSHDCEKLRLIKDIYSYDFAVFM